MELQHLQWFQLLVSVWMKGLVDAVFITFTFHLLVLFLFFAKANKFLKFQTPPSHCLIIRGGTSKNLGLRKFWQDLEILKAFLISLESHFYFFGSQNFLPRIFELGFLTRISACRWVSDFTIHHPCYNTACCIIFQFIFVHIFSSTCDQFHLLHISNVCKWRNHWFVFACVKSIIDIIALFSIINLRWFLSFVLRIPTAHDFRFISTRKWARAHTQWRRFSSS